MITSPIDILTSLESFRFSLKCQDCSSCTLFFLMVADSKFPLNSTEFSQIPINCPINNSVIADFVQKAADLCRPINVEWITGEDDQLHRLKQELCLSGTLTKLEARQNCFLARSDPRDVARNPKSTYICSSEKSDAGPLNNWADPTEMKAHLTSLFTKTMEGRTMYVIPFSMGPIGSDLSQYGIEITDSKYVVVNMAIMTRVGSKALQVMSETNEWVPCLHSVGVPLSNDENDVAWPCSPENRHIVHFTDGDPSIVSIGSGYGGNSLLGKKCFALRIASRKAKEDPNGAMAEHCLILGLQKEGQERRYIAAAFPSACGKTNLAMLEPTLNDWNATCVGDDIAWIRKNEHDELIAINPEAGFFGVAPGTSYKTNPHVMKALEKNSLFVNCAYNPETQDVWWEGMTKEIPSRLIDWKGQEWTPDCGRTAAHGNARYTVPASQCPIIDPEFESTKGVKIEAFFFGGRRDDTIPLCLESKSWDHGVLLASCMSSASTAAQDVKQNVLGHDPMAMKPFIGYHVGDYFQHWLKIGKMCGPNAPKIFMVNWFQLNSEGKFIWPGFGHNSRVLKWALERCDAKDDVSALGRVPLASELSLEDIYIDKEELDQILTLNSEQWAAEVKRMKDFLLFIGEYPSEFDTLIEEMQSEL
ncbi:hypothetical protein GEMRC1_002886 [Eukaryota sp. GEM-RC1]